MADVKSSFTIPTPVLLEMIRKAEMKVKRQREALSQSEAELKALTDAMPKERP